MDFWENKNVLITGHTGFKGSWLSLWLHLKGARVSGLSLPLSEENKFFKSLFIEDGKGKKVIEKSYYGDVNNIDFIRNSIDESKPDIIFHLAAQPLVRTSYIDPINTWQTNLFGTINLLEVLNNYKKNNCALIVITTDKVYKNNEWNFGYRESDIIGGLDPYSASKSAVEIAVSSWSESFFKKNNPIAGNIKCATARAGNVIGGGDWSKDRLVPDAIRSLLKNERIAIRNPSSRRPWQHVLEPLNGYLILGEKIYKSFKEDIYNDFCRPFNFGPPIESNKTVLELIKYILTLWHGEFQINENKDQFHESNKLFLNSDLAYKLLSWKNILDFNKTVKLTVDWYIKTSKGSNVYSSTIEDIKTFELFLKNNKFS